MANGLGFTLPRLEAIAPQSGIQMSNPPDILGGIPDPAGPQGDSGGLGVMEGITNLPATAIEALSPQEELNQNFMNRNKNIMNQIQGASKVSDVASSVASKFGLPGMIVSAGLQAGSALNKSATDEFGVVKDTSKAIAAGILNPITGISTLAGQKERREAKTQFVNTEIASKRAENQVAGNKITNAIPKFTPPSYGRFGRKLTKFTR